MDIRFRPYRRYVYFSKQDCSQPARISEILHPLRNPIRRRSGAFARLAPHQERSLSNIDSSIGEYKKLSDMSADRKPYDSHFLVNVPAYVAVCFYQPRKPKILYFIRIKDFIAFRDRHTMKSMTEEDAKVISERTLEL